MYLGYQNGKIKFYSNKPLNKAFLNIEKIVETQDEYVLDGNTYVLKDSKWLKKMEEFEAQENAKRSLTKREVFLALYRDSGITPEQIKQKITEPEVLIEFEYANEYFRGNPLIDMIGNSLGYAKEKLDYLFKNKKFPLKEGIENA